MPGLKQSHSMHIMKVLIFRRRSSGIMSAQEVILSVYWWTRFTGPEQTGTFVKIKGSGFQAQNLEGQVNRNRQKQKYQDNTDRIEIERECSVEKRSYGLGLIVTRLETTQLTFVDPLLYGR